MKANNRFINSEQDFRKMDSTILKSREARKVIKDIDSHWGSDMKISPEDHVFIKNEKDKIFVVKKDVFDIRVKNYSMGIYFGSLMKDGFRLSMEGSQLVGKSAKKNILEIDEPGAKKWMKGEDIFAGDKPVGEYVIIKFGKDFLGCGKYKDKYVLNYVPKARRIDML